MINQNVKYWVEKIIDLAIEEDLGQQSDITSDHSISEDRNINFNITARQDLIICGIDFIDLIFDKISKRYQKNNIEYKNHFIDGNQVKSQEIIISGHGNARLIFASERIILNFIQNLSSIATKSHKFAKIVQNSKIKILDTRKTIPAFRNLHKYAVKKGGCHNHRFSLFDAILIKDNHIAAAGGVNQILTNICSKNLQIPIEIECDNLQQVREAIRHNIDIIMLDNMNKKQMKEAKEIIGNKAKIEISGGITLDKIEKLLDLDIDYISVGQLTNSIDIVDIGLDIIN
ncbi:carboxylating nicotinate-nucleotide diphosphorylase [Rickettsiales bacterium]|nr:carboxylating nicotinate-nucleotide diphosphorylase [Rickettsiales bacterium]MDB2550460.1 carboxylating nicotinate-nucleotide diphosphorylase [Rickettsiales bacterium]